LISLKQSSRWSRLASLALLSLALWAAVPAQLHAQAAGDMVTSSEIKQEIKQEKKSEAEETNAYRHSPSVQWFAKKMSLNVETAAKLFEYFNFGVVLFAIAIPLIKIVPAAMRKRSARLSVELEQAQARTDDANTRLRAVETQMAGLDAEIAELRKQMEADMVRDEARSKELIEEESARIVASAEQEIAMAGSQAQRGLKQFAADLAIDRAMTQLTLNAETDRALFDEFAGEFAGKHKKRGQN
jgi:F-type H+-transporting ATPase subunit b